MNFVSENVNNPTKKKSKNEPTHLYMDNNHLKTIPKNTGSENVLVLYLHNNSICEINNLDELCNLTHLYLQWNKIRRIENLSCLRNLTKLYLGNNQINVVENLEDLGNLKELHIDHQVLENGEVLCFDPRCISTLGPRLQVLNISDNRMSHFSELSCLKNLSKLIAKNNLFKDYLSIAEDLKRLSKIKEINFKGNPMCKIHRYKEKIIAACFKLEIIDEKFIPEQTRQFLKCFDRFQSNLNKKSNILSGKKYNESKKGSTSKSPDAHLSFLETQRMAAVQARLSRQKMLEAHNGVVPRCFWRNKNTKQSKELFNRDENMFHNFSKTTSTMWP